MTTIIQIGNQTAPHATEAAYRDGYEAVGCTVIGVDQAEAFERGARWFRDQCLWNWHPDLVVYSRTHNNTALGAEWTDAWREMEICEINTASVHLDVFWGIPEREAWIGDGDALFTTGLVLTADGGSDEKWEAAGVNHRWLPPGADARFIPEHVEPVAELAGKIVFVGSSRGYHPAYPMRDLLIQHARETWPDRFVEYGNGTPNGQIRGEDLARVYASDCICLGDSCFAGARANYWSDRIPETLARGGFLMHPWLPGLRSMYDGTVLATYKAGDFEDLDAQIGAFLANPGEREGNKERGRALALSRDTYRHRAVQVLEAVGLR